MGSSWEVPNFNMLARLGSSWEVHEEFKIEPELSPLFNGEKKKGAALSPPLSLVKVAFRFGIVSDDPTAHELIKELFPSFWWIVSKGGYPALIDSFLAEIAQHLHNLGQGGF